MLKSLIFLRLAHALQNFLQIAEAGQGNAGRRFVDRQWQRGSSAAAPVIVNAAGSGEPAAFIVSATVAILILYRTNLIASGRERSA